MKRSPFAQYRMPMMVSLGVLAIVAAVIAWILYTPAPSVNDGTISIVAGEDFWGDIASQIGGSQVQVTSLISNPTADPHLFESSAKDALAVSTAQIVIKNGLGYDDFLNKLLSGTPSNATILSADQIVGAKPSDNPHLWYDPTKAMQVATAIETALSQRDPAHQPLYRQRLDHFQANLLPVITTLSNIKSTYPNIAVAYTERVPGYLLQAAGLLVKTPAQFSQALEAGNDPSPADSQAMQQLIIQRTIKVLIINPQASSPISQQLETLAQQHHLPVVTMTETLPAHQHFQDWQLAQARALLDALGR